MRKLFKLVPEYVKDIRKRVAREFANGTLSKEEFDKAFKACDMLTSVSLSSEGAGEGVGEKHEGKQTGKAIDAQTSGHQGT